MHLGARRGLADVNLCGSAASKRLQRFRPGHDSHKYVIRRVAKEHALDVRRVHPGMKVARERNTTVITIGDVEEMGVDKAVEIALECAWKDAEAVFLSFDIDSIDPGFAPGTGSPEPGGLLPREALKALRMIAREGICGMEVVEIAPRHDVSDITAQLGCRAIMDVLGSLVDAGKLGTRRPPAQPGESSPEATPHRLE
jgi:arginase family enzyme